MFVAKTAMTKEEYLKIAEIKWDELNQLSSETEFLAYENKFSEIWRELGRLVLESSLGTVPKDRRVKKKLPPRLDGSK